MSTYVYIYIYISIIYYAFRCVYIHTYIYTIKHTYILHKHLARVNTYEVIGVTYPIVGTAVA